MKSDVVISEKSVYYPGYNMLTRVVLHPYKSLLKINCAECVFAFRKRGFSYVQNISVFNNGIGDPYAPDITTITILPTAFRKKGSAVKNNRI